MWTNQDRYDVFTFFQTFQFGTTRKVFDLRMSSRPFAASSHRQAVMYIANVSIKIGGFKAVSEIASWVQGSWWSLKNRSGAFPVFSDERAAFLSDLGLKENFGLERVIPRRLLASDLITFFTAGTAWSTRTNTCARHQKHLTSKKGSSGWK